MMNLTELSWTHDGLNTDGTRFTEDQFAGFTLYVNGAPRGSVPASWSAQGEYSVPLAGLIDEPGAYSVAMTVAARNGTESELSDPLVFELRELSEPTAPFGLSVS